MVDKYSRRGLTPSEELSDRHLYRDTRSTGKKIAEELAKRDVLTIVMGATAVISAFLGFTAEIMLLVAVGLSAFGLTRREYVPLRIPIQEADAVPGKGSSKEATGIFFLGNDKDTGKELWLDNGDCRQHFLILGTTGSGKAQPLDAAILTPSGWHRMGDLTVGDLVTTPDDRTARIDGVYPQGRIPIYRFTFADGRTTEACGNHIWRVLRADGRAENRTTDEIRSAMANGETDFEIPLPAPLNSDTAIPASDHPASLGNRVAQRAWFTTESSQGTGVDTEITETTRDDVSLVSGLQTVNPAYRAGFLMGLMKPNVDRGPATGIAVTTHELGTAIRDLVRSLGGVANVAPFDRGYVVQGWFPDPVGGCCFYLKGGFTGHFPTGLPIAHIEPIGEKEAQCIHIDHPDHLYITDNYVVTHNTETLLGFCANALSWGSGFFFCDGKGDVSTFAKVYTLARLFGREDDLLVLNFMTGNRDIGFEGGHKLSNTTNPFSSGSADNLTQMVVSLMEEAGGDNAMWKGRAQALVSAEIDALVHLRDQGLLDLNVGTIRDHMTLQRMYDLAYGDQYNFPQHIQNKLQKFMETVPGFKPEKGHNQSQQTFDQFGFLAMQLTKVLSSLADVYGHVFSTPAGEVDMHDVVLNRRILVIMLPSLEKSPDEVESLGKIVVSQLKSMMGGALGNQIEGSWHKVVDQRLTNAPSPFPVILDEVGYYTSNGMAMMSAQARSLGFALTFAAQDIQSMKRSDAAAKETDSIVANCNTKIFMKVEEAENTAQLAQSLAGKGKTTQAKQFQGQAGMVDVRQADSMESHVEEKDRVDLLDLKAFDKGEMLIIRDDHIFYADSFFANPEGNLDKYNLQLRTNHFIKIPKPSYEELQQQWNLPKIRKRLLDPKTPERMTAAARKTLGKRKDRVRNGDEICSASVVMEKSLDRLGAIDAACAAVANVAQNGEGAQKMLQKELENSQQEATDFSDISSFIKTDDDEEGGAESDDEDQALPPDEDDPTGNAGVGNDELAMLDQLRQPQVDKDTEHGVSVDDEKHVDLTRSTLRTQQGTDLMDTMGRGVPDDSAEDDGQESESEAHQRSRISEGVEDVFNETGETREGTEQQLQQANTRTEQAYESVRQEEKERATDADAFQDDGDSVPQEDLSALLTLIVEREEEGDDGDDEPDKS